MTPQIAVVPDADAESLWRNWTARGAESDRRTAKTMRRVLWVIVVTYAVWFVVQFA